MEHGGFCFLFPGFGCYTNAIFEKDGLRSTVFFCCSFSHCAVRRVRLWLDMNWAVGEMVAFGQFVVELDFCRWAWWSDDGVVAWASRLALPNNLHQILDSRVYS